MARKSSRAVTHDDLAPSAGWLDVSSKTAATLMASTAFCGFICFGLCLIAEASRTRMERLQDDENGEICAYSGSGRIPLTCAAVALGGLAAAVVVQHLYLLMAVSRSPPLLLVTWDPETSLVKNLICQATSFFVAAWVCFGAGEILLLVGLSVESGHFTDWSSPKSSCLVLKKGIFSGAGVFALLTIFLSAGVYVTVLRAQRISQENDELRREVLETSVLYASPGRSPRLRVRALERENPLTELSPIGEASVVAANFMGK